VPPILAWTRPRGVGTSAACGASMLGFSAHLRRIDRPSLASPHPPSGGLARPAWAVGERQLADSTPCVMVSREPVRSSLDAGRTCRPGAYRPTQIAVASFYPDSGNTPPRGIPGPRRRRIRAQATDGEIHRAGWSEGRYRVSLGSL
jgi:hypothetical protein